MIKIVNHLQFTFLILCFFSSDASIIYYVLGTLVKIKQQCIDPSCSYNKAGNLLFSLVVYYSIETNCTKINQFTKAVIAIQLTAIIECKQYM